MKKKATFTKAMNRMEKAGKQFNPVYQFSNDEQKASVEKKLVDIADRAKTEGIE